MRTMTYLYAHEEDDEMIELSSVDGHYFLHISDVTIANPDLIKDKLIEELNKIQEV